LIRRGTVRKGGYLVMRPEEEARQKIDQVLVAAGRHIALDTAPCAGIMRATQRKTELSEEAVKAGIINEVTLTALIRTCDGIEAILTTIAKRSRYNGMR
jgi:hypothetical protein